ncbi:MAG: hypothetical protein A2Y38_08165 [Spirochaetes bacterium GWB1_59_5]|nr:MAG: hypothetical protein A2Y38_08165 [Spirochaetes bacterium GWB1_59_5]
MRREGTVQHKLKQVLYRHLQKRLRANFRLVPQACRHNREVGDSNVGVCMVTVEGRLRGTLCDARYEGIPVAKACPWFEPRQTKDEIQAEFRVIFGDPHRGLLGVAFPDVAALLWVLDPETDSPVLNDAVDTTLALFQPSAEGDTPK